MASKDYCICGHNTTWHANGGCKIAGCRCAYEYEWKQADIGGFMGRCVCVGDCICGLKVGPQPPTRTLTEEQWKTLKNFFKMAGRAASSNMPQAAGKIDGGIEAVSWIVPGLFNEG